MSLEQFISLRYVFSKKRIGFVTVISLISVIGVTIGVAALVVVLAVFNGFGSLVTSLLVSFDPHIRVERIGRAPEEDFKQLVESLRANTLVAAQAAFISGKALVVSKNVNRVVYIRGIQSELIDSVSGVKQKIVLGELDFKKVPAGVVLGMNLADRLGAIVGDTISVVSPAAAEMATYQMGFPLIRRYTVIGLYESNNKDYDSYYAFVNLETAQSLFAAGSKIDGYEIRLHDLHEAEGVTRDLRSRFGETYRVSTWYDLHRELYTVMKVERWSAYIILCLIIAVASFNLLGSLTMTVIEKTRDIGILRAMGATRETIKKIFLIQGMIVGIAGTLFGLALGLLVVYLQERYHLFPLDQSVYIIAAIPVEVHWVDLVLIAFAAFGLCLLASRNPALRASNLNPVEAIRWE